MPVGGTASGRALRDALELLTGEDLSGTKIRRRVGTTFKRAKSQIIVLITDGEDHQGDPLAVARVAKQKGIRIYTIGFGSDKGEPIPVYQNGQAQGYMKNREGDTVYTKLNAEPLEKIAETTGGRYYHYSGRGTVANAITRTLNRLEKEELGTMLRIKAQERFVWPLALSVFFLFASTLVGQRRGIYPGFWAKLRRDRDEIGKTAVRLVIPLLVVPASLWLGGCDALHETFVMAKVSTVDEGNTLLAAGKGEEALAKYKEAEAEVPSTPELHLDMGLAHMATGELDNAVAEFSRAVESPHEDLRYAALFNLGIAYYRQEKWKESLEALKGALRLRPNAEDAKAAYEVALYQVYPPCSKLEDDLEDNDDRSAASQLAEPERKDLTLCGGDADWFAVGVYPGSIVRVKATFRRLRDKEPGDGELLPAPDMLRIALFGQDGEEVLAVSKLTEEEDPKADAQKGDKKKDESLTMVLGPIKLTADMLKLAPPLGDKAATPALVRVDNDAPTEFKYDLEVAVIPPCFALEDSFEDNDTLATAAALQPELAQDLHICKNDEEWFSFDLKAGEALFVDVVAGRDLETDTVPNLELELLDETGVTSLSEVESMNTPMGPLWGVGLKDNEVDRTVKVHIKGFENDQQGPYQLRVYHYPPCPTGDDRLEENDSPAAPAEFPVQEGVVRHLRYCPGDPDYLKITSKKDDKIVLGLRYDESMADNVSGAAPMRFRLLDSTGTTLVVDSVPTESAPPEQTPVQLVVATEKFEEEEVVLILEIDSEVDAPRFYDIIPLDGNSQQQQQPESGDDEQDKEQDKADSEQDKEQEQDKGDEESEKEEPKAPEEADDETRAEQLEEILESLEEGDDNFQLKKALQKMPNRIIENDW
jgi:tetratricopeptide (TPR) repeat protein